MSVPRATVAVPSSPPYGRGSLIDRAAVLAAPAAVFRFQLEQRSLELADGQQVVPIEDVLDLWREVIDRAVGLESDD